MNEILIRGLEIFACHGVHDYEKTTPQKFVFDIDIKTDFSAVSKSDDLNGTINYSAACNLIAEITKSNCFNLIEKLAYECAYSLLENFPKISAVKLTVYKPEAPVKHKFENVGVSVEVGRERAYLSLGSSMGDKKNYLDTAIKKLNETRGVAVKKVSSYIQTAPYGGVAKNKFLNCAVEIETFLSPKLLLNEINRIERELGRERAVHWDDRTLDIDIIFYGNKIICEENLTIPHPEYQKRDFVLIPLKEIAPNFLCPLLNKRIKDI